MRPLGRVLSAVGGRGSFEDGAAARFADGEGQIDRAQERLFFENHAALDEFLSSRTLPGQLWLRIRRRVSSVMPRIDFLNLRL